MAGTHGWAGEVGGEQPVILALRSQKVEDEKTGATLGCVSRLSGAGSGGRREREERREKKKLANRRSLHLPLKDP